MPVLFWKVEVKHPYAAGGTVNCWSQCGEITWVYLGGWNICIPYDHSDYYTISLRNVSSCALEDISKLIAVLFFFNNKAL